MKSIFIPTKGAEDWKQFLAEPGRQWKTGHSAKALANCWEDAWKNQESFPISVRNILEKKFPGIIPLLSFPEYQVSLPGGKAPSQCDIWVLARSSDELISIAVEGKVKESFGETIDKWEPEKTEGKKQRFHKLLEILRLPHVPRNIRYQLLHRTASAIIETERFNAAHAVTMVHAFNAPEESWNDFAEFVSLFGIEAKRNGIASKPLESMMTLHLVWVDGEEMYLRR